MGLRQRFNSIAFAICSSPAKNPLPSSGLPPITFHSVRHSYATASLESGMPVMILSARLGHSTPALTLNVYSHALPATDKAEAARVAAELD